MKMVSRATMVEMFGEAVVKTLEGGTYDISITQPDCEELIRYDTTMSIQMGKEDNDDARLWAFCEQDKEIDQDDMCWDRPDFYA